MSRLTLLTSKVQQQITQHEPLSILVELDATRILMNCVYGVLQSLLEIGIHHNDIDHIILPYFQPEYLADLLPFLHVSTHKRTKSREKDLHIYSKAETRRFINTFIDIFALNKLQTYTIVFHELADANTLLDICKKDSFNLRVSENQFLHLSLGEKRYVIIKDFPPDRTKTSLFKSADLVVINSDTIEEDALVSFAVDTSIKHIIYASTYNENNPHLLQKMAEARGYRGTIRVGYNLMSFAL